MLTRLKVQNFRSIRELDLRLSPFTALVGPNGSGKSTVLAALDHRSVLAPSWRHLPGDIVIERIESSGLASRSIPSSTTGGHFNVAVQHLRLNLDVMREATELKSGEATECRRQQPRELDLNAVPS